MKEGDGGGEKGRGIKERPRKGGGKKRVTRGSGRSQDGTMQTCIAVIIHCRSGNIHILLQTECRVLTLPRA